MDSIQNIEYQRLISSSQVNGLSTSIQRNRQQQAQHRGATLNARLLLEGKFSSRSPNGMNDSFRVTPLSDIIVQSIRIGDTY